MYYLDIFDSGAGTSVAVPLSRIPAAVSVRPDGLAAAVGHDGLISLVNLQTGTVTAQITIPTNILDLAYAANGYIYVVPKSSNCCSYYSVNTADGAVTEGRYSGPGQSMRIHPSGESLYTGDYRIVRFLINGPSLSMVSSTNSAYSNSVWLSQDGLRAFSSYGSVYRTSNNPATDLAPNGSLNSGSGTQPITWADHSVLRSAVAVTSMVTNSYPYRYGVFVYGDEFLGLGASYQFPVFRIGNVDYTNEGRYVFWGKDGNRLTAISRLTGTPTLLSDSMITTIRANTGSGGCTASLSGSSADVAANGQSGSVGVTVGTECNWTSSSNASWLRVTAGSFGIGPTTVSYTADRNPYGLPRQAVLTIGGQSFTVNQAAGAPTATPSLVSVSPSSPSTTTAAVTFTARDQDGFANLSRIYFQIGDSTAIAANGCHGFYDRLSNQVALYNDGLSGLLPGLAIGTASTVENSQCRVNGTGSSVVSAAGTDLSITLNMALKGSYLQGSKKLYVWVTDQQNNGTGWVEAGTWTPAVPVNVAPTIVTFAPETAAGTAQTLSVQARDTNGTDDIARVYFLVNSNTVIPQNGCHGFYERASNRIFLYNDALSAVVGPITPGGTGSIENSQCKINAATSAMSVSGGVNLNLTLGMEVKGAYSTGTRNVYYWAVDTAASGTGWVTGTVWSATSQPANQAPTVVSGTPGTITTATETLTIVTRDLDGYTNLSRVYFLINPTVTIPANTCHGLFDRGSNTFFLYGDGLSTVASLPAGTSGTLQNSQCAIDVAQSQVTSASGTDLSFTLRVTLKGSLTSGTQKVALWAQDAQGNGTGWVQTSNWTVTAGVGPTAPTLVSVTPSSTTAATNTFTVTARDANGYNTISRVYFLIHSTAVIPANGCHGFYDQALNAIYLYNDALSAVIGPVRPGQSGQTAANGQCSITGAGFAVAGSGTDLTLTLPVTVTGTYATGNRNLYFWAVDATNLGTGWQTGASIGLGAPVTPAAPVIASATPSSTSGNGRLFSVTARDANGAADLNRVYFLLAPTATITANSCHGYYERSSNKVYLYNAALTGLVSGSITPGVSGALSNGQCSLDGSLSAVSASGNDLTLGLHLTRLGTYALANLNVYWWAVDNAATGTGWVPGSNWTP